MKSTWEVIEPRLWRHHFSEGERVACAFLGDVYLHNYSSLKDLQDARNKTEGYHRGGEYFNGPPYGLAYDDSYLYLKLPDDLDLDDLQLVLSGNPLVKIQNSSGLIFDGFTLQGRSTGIRIDELSTNATIRNCIILGAAYGVMTNADYTLVEWCEFTVPGLDTFNEELMKIKTYIYFLMKERGLEGGLVYSRKVPAPRFLESRYNYIHSVFDGDGLGQFDDSTIHHNIYHDCFDNAVEFEPNVKGKAGANLNFYENKVSGFSRGYLSHQQNGVDREQAKREGWLMKGPHYVHHNVIIADGDVNLGWKPWTIIKSRPWDNHMRIVYAHNLIYGRTKTDLFWYKPDWESGLANMTWLSNVILLPEGVATEPVPFFANSNALLAPSTNPKLTGEDGFYVTAISDLDYTNNAPQYNPGPFKTGYDITPDWPRPAARAYAPE
ncbi:hypothetical protein [Cerasicoccus arenae]|uniref:hypothetical protein n=1 Tax=Cerasicoccus arenae TaxID=424488 RepID=UPI001673572A|nr:hypothetical protein [Cerasicoccus arenae]